MPLKLKIVLFTRHYPPAISGGARRPWITAQALRRLGHDVFVVAPSLPEGEYGLAVPHPHRDPPEETGLIASQSIRDIAREWLLWPDPDIRWVKKAWRATKRRLTTDKFYPNLIITTSPPESIHAIGSKAASHFSALWVADFRDQWFERAFRIERRKPLRRILEQRYAKFMLRKLDGFYAVNDFILEEIGAFAPNRAHRSTIPHIAPPPTAPKNLPTEHINIVHTGSFSLSDPDCRINELLTIFEQAVSRKPNLRLHLVGRLSTDEKELVSRSIAAEEIKMYGPLPIQESLSFQSAADALIVVTAPHAPVPPGKFAEYQRYNTPIIPISAKQWTGKAGLTGDAPGVQLLDLKKKQAGAKNHVADAWTEIEAWGEMLEDLYVRIKDQHKAN